MDTSACKQQIKISWCKMASLFEGITAKKQFTRGISSELNWNYFEIGQTRGIPILLLNYLQTSFSPSTKQSIPN
jgi:hypothetical protein